MDPVVLVEGGAGHQTARVTLCTARLLHAAAVEVDVVSWNGRSLAASSRVVRTRTRVVDGEAARSWLASHAPVRVLPTSDAGALAIGAPGSDLVDKRALHAHAIARDVPVPETEVLEPETLRAAAWSLTYPVIVKPVIGKPAQVARHPSDIAPFLARIQPGVAVVVQPRLPGRIHSVGGLVRHGTIEALIHQVTLRTWPEPTGTSTAATTVEPDDLLEARARSLVDGLEGIFQAQFLDGRLIDLNLRPYGSVGLAARAGVNLPALWAGPPVGGAVRRARPGVRYRWVEGDLLLAVSRIVRAPSRSLEVLWSHRPHLGTAHGDASSARDPGPAIARIVDRVRRGGSTA